MLRTGAPSCRKRIFGGDDPDYSDDGDLSDGAKKDFNSKAMRDGDVVVHRAPVLRFLTAPRSVLSKPFQIPCPDGWRMPVKERGLGSMTSGRRSLGMTRRKISGAMSAKFKRVSAADIGDDDSRETFTDVQDELFEKYKQNPIVLQEGQDGHKVIVEPVLGKYLREHQRQGIQFLWECVGGLRPFDGCGCILADDMGLGKTLQSITLIYTAIRQGPEKDKPLAKRVIVVTPTSLVRNWDNEIDKWLKGRVRCLAIAESNRAECVKSIKKFTTTRLYDVLVISYDTFRLNLEHFEGEGKADLLICDEAHRLKNDQTQTSKALDKLHTKRRVLLSGTPMQNDLEEFFAMVNFCNPNVLGTVSQFRKKYQNPILIGREPDATDKEVKLSEQRSQELSDIVNMFILRRTNSLLSKHLPPKLTQIVCVKLTPMQEQMYRHMVYSKMQWHDDNKDKKNEDKERISAASLASINALKKLCNHPQLLYQKESIYTQKRAGSKKNAAFGLDDINQFFPEGFASGGGGSRRSRGSMGSSSGPTENQSNCEWSGKFLVCLRLLTAMRHETDDRMVIVSNYTQTLDLFSMMCQENNFPYVRLDGTCSAKRRQAMVDRLNDPSDDVFVFLLSSKAGGCGLNLIGANRLILFDPDWNPATDKQAAARVWRDGQKKRTYVYRFLATGTIEEKVYQRQLSKEGLQSVVADDQSLESTISSTDLKDLFRYKEDCVSDTHEKYKCKRCNFEGLSIPPVTEMKLSDQSEMLSPKAQRASLGSRSRGVKRTKPNFVNLPATVPPTAEQDGFPNEGDLNEWSHHFGCDSVDDALLRKAGRGLVSFVFGQAIDGESLAKKAALEAEAKKAAERESENQDQTEDDASEVSPANGDSSASSSSSTPISTKSSKKKSKAKKENESESESESDEDESDESDESDEAESDQEEEEREEEDGIEMELQDDDDDDNEEEEEEEVEEGEV